MKLCLCALIFILFSTCKYPVKNTPPKQTEQLKNELDTTTEVLEEEDTPLTKEDSTVIIVYAEGGDTLSYTAYELKKILEYYPSLNDTLPLNPDENYRQKTSWRDIKEKDRDVVSTFNSEAGRDSYYILYGCLLEQKNGINRYKAVRKKLTEIYRTINDIHAYLNSGGTYFGHQYKRIIGYAEYGVFYYKHYGQDYVKEYKVNAQKKLFIAALKQYCYDEVKWDNNNGLTNKYKEEKIKNLSAIINTLDSLVTDYFLLKQAQTFEFTYY